jgi:hypothetical protein
MKLTKTLTLTSKMTPLPMTQAAVSATAAPMTASQQEVTEQEVLSAVPAQGFSSI